MPRDARLGTLQLVLAYLVLAASIAGALPSGAWRGTLEVQWPDIDVEQSGDRRMVLRIEGHDLDTPLELVEPLDDLVGPFDEPVAISLRHADGQVEVRSVRRGSYGVTSALESMGASRARATAAMLLRLRAWVDVAWRVLLALSFLLLAPRHPTAVAWAVVSLSMVALNFWGPVERLALSVTYATAVLGTAIAVLTYPDGRLSRAETVGVAAVFLALGVRQVTGWDGMLFATAVVAVLLVWAATNAARASGVDRQRYKWLGLALGFVVAVMLLDAATLAWGTASLQLLSFVWDPIGGTLAFMCVLLPIIRFRMWDLPLFVGQGLVLALTGLLLVVTDFVVGTVASALVGPAVGDDLVGGGVGYVIALVIAVSVHPALQRLVERLAFPRLEIARTAFSEGRRALHLTRTEDAALRAAVDAPSRAFDVEAVMGDDRTFEAGAWVPHGASEALVVPIADRVLLVPAPHGSRHLTSNERSLLDDWAGEVAIALERTRHGVGRPAPTP